MEKKNLSPREKLQFAYELAFYPPRFHALWKQVKNDNIENKGKLLELVEMALTLHQALPESGYASQRALRRLALYQADSRAFGMVTTLKNLRKFLGRSTPFKISEVPGSMVRDIGLPPLGRLECSKNWSPFPSTPRRGRRSIE